MTSELLEFGHVGKLMSVMGKMNVIQSDSEDEEKSCIQRQNFTVEEILSENLQNHQGNGKKIYESLKNKKLIMDILKPPLLWIDGACYRRNPVENFEINAGYTGELDDDICNEVDEEVEDGDKFLVTETQNGNFKAVLHIPNELYKFIIGVGGRQKVAIEKETNANITIPKQNHKSSYSSGITVSAKTRSNVVKACRHLTIIANKGRSKIPFTHFISIPLNSEEIINNYNSFIENVKNIPNNSYDFSLFQNSNMLHLTIGTLVLLDNEDREAAKSVLEDCKSSIVKQILCDSNLLVSLKDLEIMNDDFEQVHVLYAKVHSAGLQEISDAIVDRFETSGFMTKEYDRVKLHATLMNSNFLKTESHGSKSLDFSKFNAIPIMESLKDFNFGKIQVNEIHISQRHSAKKMENGYYFPLSIMNF